MATASASAAASQLSFPDSPSNSAAADSDSQKAWHLLSLLLSLGRPTPPPELAFRCTLFPLTSDLVVSLCSIPNSPIALAYSSCGDFTLLVTVSLFGLLAVARFASSCNLVDEFVSQVESRSKSDLMRVYYRKRKRIGFDRGDEGEKDREATNLSKKLRNACTKVLLPFSITEDIRRNITANSNHMPFMLNASLTLNLFVKTIVHNCQVKNTQQIEHETNAIATVKMEQKQITACDLDDNFAFPSRTSDDEAQCQEAQVDETNLRSRTDVKANFCLEDNENNGISPVDSLCAHDTSNTTTVPVKSACNATVGGCIKTIEMFHGGGLLTDSSKIARDTDELFQQIDAAALNKLSLVRYNFKRANERACLDKDPVTTPEKNHSNFPKTELSVAQKQLSKDSKLSATEKTTGREAMASRQRAFSHLLEQSKAMSPLKENQQCKRDHRPICLDQKSRQKPNNMHAKEVKKDVSVADQAECKNLPNFESYVLEEEEGSGGYGTVYRARRRTDGKMVAIKCPHANAHRQHVSNEQRMLERFGGKNFIIKYEGRIKSGDSDCFVLEHVEHDRPEVLKKEIDVFQLRWYGYCMFRALASLHKQGIVHRDVKPGNFLFCRKTHKGYLIDFNLAMDLHQKYGTNKSKAGNDVTFNNITLPNAKYVPPTKTRRILSAKSMDTFNQDATKGLKSTLDPKNLKKKAVDQTKMYKDLGSLNITKSQGPDGSVITSVKDVTNTRTPSAERVREPLPCHGRKELISLLKESMRSPNHEASSVPASIRKRIAAPGRVDGRRLYVTPMPLYPTGFSVAVTGFNINKGDGKQKKEGPCVGTKGFRAPEVLFRSLHQGPKVDVWSAGVTLLYLIIGRTPFYGDPEQNLKDIAKLRGSEDLWEVAKLHDQESSFPVDLYKTQSLPSMTLREWCKMNSKRQEFIDLIPNSLIDLVDKCLTANPRLRISAEEALKHEFFAPCHEDLRKQRLLRQGLSSDSATPLPLERQNGISKSVKMFHQQA